MSTTDPPRIDAHERRSSALRCPFCHDALAADGARACPDCGTLTHPACADEARGCPTIGCRRGRAPVAAPVDPRPLAVFGALVVPLGGAVGLCLGGLYAGRLVQDALEDGVCLAIGLGLAGVFAGFLAGLIVRGATRRGTTAAWIVAGLLLACPTLGGVVAGFHTATRDRSHDGRSGPFR